MMRIALFALAGLTLAACNSAVYDPQRFPPASPRAGGDLIEERARSVAGDYALTVRTVDVETKEQRFNDDEDRTVNGYVAWMTVAECEQGNFVVKFNVAGVPIQTYTRFGCQVEGVPSY